VAPLERTLQYRTSGHVNGHETQQALLTLLDKILAIYVLRDSDGSIRFAFYARGGLLYRCRDRLSDPWQVNWSCDPAELLKLLRSNNYLSAEAESVLRAGSGQVAHVRDRFDHDNPMQRPIPLPGEWLLMGLKASPGRIVGYLLLGTAGRGPSDFEDTILAASSARPEDSIFLCSCAGIISTSGGILSHAGLLDMQYRKPALIVAGNWTPGGESRSALSLRSLEYSEEVHHILGYRVAIFGDVTSVKTGCMRGTWLFWMRIKALSARLDKIVMPWRCMRHSRCSAGRARSFRISRIQKMF